MCQGHDLQILFTFSSCFMDSVNCSNSSIFQWKLVYDIWMFLNVCSVQISISRKAILPSFPFHCIEDLKFTWFNNTCTYLHTLPISGRYQLNISTWLAFILYLKPFRQCIPSMTMPRLIQIGQSNNNFYQKKIFIIYYLFVSSLLYILSNY